MRLQQVKLHEHKLLLTKVKLTNTASMWSINLSYSSLVLLQVFFCFPTIAYEQII